jgi:G3E family GTPase
MVAHQTQPIPLTILTGFLGAGKTTLLNRLLHADHGLRVAVLVNDFGSINIDTQLVVGVEGEAISLANGCICCTIRDDLLATTLGLLDRPDRPEYLLIEASGVSDPWAVAETFMLPEVKPYINLDSVITVVDAEQVRQVEHYDDLILSQISAADVVVLSKTDLVSPDERAEVEDWVRQIVPNARILPAIQGEVPFRLLLGVGRYKLDLLPIQPAHQHHEHEHHAGCGCDHDHDHEHHHDHGAEFSTWSYVNQKPSTLKTLRRSLSALPSSVFRGKGMVYLAEAPSRRAVFQMVGTRLSLVLSEPWGDTPPQTQLVFIGTPNSFEADDLQRRFDATLAPSAPSPIEAEQHWVRESA